MTNLQTWEQKGYVVLRGFFSQSRVDSINESLDSVWRNRSKNTSKVTLDAFLESPAVKRILFSNAEDEARYHPYKLNDLYLESESLRSLILDESLRKILHSLFGGEPLVCNSLNLGFSPEQCDHIDSMFIPPRIRNKLLVSWIALDEVDITNGPVRYYPESHKLPPYRFSHGRQNVIDCEMDHFRKTIQDQLRDKSLAAQKFTAQPGDVLIWHGQLVHGGTPIIDFEKPRRSVVTHYFRKRDYQHHFWRIKRAASGGYYYKRRHQKIQ